ncbi:hypothetical protein Sp245p_25180 (plasmid) [Azospirillum baldaniorum]|uniref:Uncharacterized protein n=1 Tax=Azospirillum baldaniorum TaxID=1064539 RepID=A0A9P1JYL4_9PROT|nr:hypothetical protein Sp245p_25180 [Azospirillum baldaniorum]CCD02268.1 protein of unknown function [Azospirillum baldaniorum]
MSPDGAVLVGPAPFRKARAMPWFGREAMEWERRAKLCERRPFLGRSLRVGTGVNCKSRRPSASARDAPIWPDFVVSVGSNPLLAPRFLLIAIHSTSQILLEPQPRRELARRLRRPLALLFHSRGQP